MGDRLAMRAASLSWAAFLLMAAIVAALSIRFVLVPEPEQHQPPAIDSVFDPPKPPVPPPPIVRPPQPPQPRDEQAAPPLGPIMIDETAPKTPTEYPVDPVVEPPTITRPEWVRYPSNLQIYYPRRALELGREGV